MPTEWRGRTNITKNLGSIIVLRMVMPTEWRERTNITKKKGQHWTRSYAKVKQMGKKRTSKYSNNLLYFILFYFIFLSSIEPVRRRKLKSSTKYRYVEWQRWACNHVLTVQQNREGYQHSHFCSRSINRLYMGITNGELAVMYATISYHTYLGIHRCDLAHATNNRAGGSGISTRPPYLKRKADSY